MGDAGVKPVKRVVVVKSGLTMGERFPLLPVSSLKSDVRRDVAIMEVQFRRRRNKQKKGAQSAGRADKGI